MKAPTWLIQSRETIARAIKREEESFAGTLGDGLKDFNERAKKLTAAGSRTLPGADAFFLYDTRGLPLEIIEDLAQENGLVVDEVGFAKAFETQRDRSRQDYLSGKVREEVAQEVFKEKTTFVGYGIESSMHASVRAIIVDGERSETIEAGQPGELVLDATPFYAEAGGQVGDTGFIAGNQSRARVTNTIYRGTTITHQVQMEAGSLQVGEEIEAV
jgi:alanyl-tRNA synthetase